MPHEIVHQDFLGHIFVASLSKFLFDRDSAGIMKGIRLISVGIGLNQEPHVITQLIVSFGKVSFPLDDHTLIVL